MSENHFRSRYLMGAMQQKQLEMTVRLFGIAAEVEHVREITRSWRDASERMVQLANTEAGLPDQIGVSDPPPSIQARLDEIAQDKLFQASFSQMPTDFKVVQIERLVAPQRDVNLDYVDDLRARIPGKSIEQLIEFCVGPRAEAPELKALQTAANQMTYSSKSLDLRFLSGSPKLMTEADIEVAHGGGQPVETICLLVGYGAAPINGWMAGQRIVLGNGFHRIVAMKMEGIEHVPMVIQHVANSEIEFPDQYLGLSRAYLLKQERPALVKDFFDALLTVDLRMKARRKILKVSWGTEESIAPD